MDKIQEVADGTTHTTIENDKRLNNETSNFLQQVSIPSSTREKITMIDITPQIIASCIIHCMVIKAGINMAYSAVLLNALKSDSDMKVTEKEESWIASLVTITLPIGSIIVGPLMDKFGRKTVCLLSCIPAAISWILLILAKSLVTIYVARVIAGIAAGLTTVGLVYISELSHPQVRPMLLCLNSVFVSLGILITCCLTILVDWRKMAMIYLALDCCIFFALYFVPESPYWLACFTNGMFDEKRICKMKRSLRRLNRRQTIYEQEFSRIMETCGNQTNNERSKNIISIKNYYQKFTSPSVYKPITILFFLFLLQQLSGCYVIIFYAFSVFREMGGSFGKGFDENDAFVMLGIIRFVVSIITVFCSKKYGRRVLCILSGIGMTISMFLSGMYMYFTMSYDENGNIEETMVDQKWLLLFFVLSYISTSTFGFLNIPWTLIGELLPVSIRGIGGGLMVSLAYIMMFAVVKNYPYISRCMSIQGIFFSFSFMSLIGTAFVYFFLPETLGKSFSDIEKVFLSTRERETHGAIPRTS